MSFKDIFKNSFLNGFANGIDVKTIVIGLGVYSVPIRPLARENKASGTE